MTTSAARPVDPDFPGVEPQVVQAYRDAPENVIAEIIDGQLSLMPRPRPRHATAATRLARALGGLWRW